MSGDDAGFDAAVALAEHGDPCNTTDPATMRSNHEAALTAGLLDHDEPTPWTDYVRRQADADVAAMPEWVRDLYRSALDAAASLPTETDR